MKPSVHLAPAHPCMGWVSMNRYWQALRQESAGDSEVMSLLSPGPVEAPPGPPWVRQWNRRVAYPLLVRAKVRDGVLHVLDQSFADLLPHARRGVRTVVTVHDLIPLTDPGDLTPAQRSRYQRTVSYVRRADRVVCVSSYTAGEVQRLLQIPQEKLCVLPNGTSTLPSADGAMSARLKALPPFIFSVGGTRPRKNLKLLVPLARHLAEQGKRVTVVRAGARLEETLAAQIRKHADLHELGSVTDAELSAGYVHAALTLVPSQQEGFGLPVLEAMQAGCPVAYCLATSLPEVAGEAALGFDPENAGQAAQHCLSLLTDTDLRAKLVIAGRARAARFTWKAHWQGLRRIYDELLN